MHMKKIVVISMILTLLCVVQSNGQVGKFLKNVKNSVTQDLLGGSDKPKTAPEPPCACDPAELVMEIGKLKIDYTELNINVLDDGSILLTDRMAGNYYIHSKGATEGPFKENNPRVKQFQAMINKDENPEAILTAYRDYINKSGDKYLITFAGKSYGPYARIDKFTVSKSKDKFAAMVVETIVVTEDEGAKMEQAMNNAKTENEKMQLALQYSQLMQERLLNGGGVEGISPKIVSNVPGATTDVLTAAGGQFYNNLKYDDILIWGYNKVTDLQGKTIMTFAQGTGCSPESMFISSDNSRYACYSYGTLTFSDGKTLSELFNPTLIRENGKVFLAYMYYSPKKNSILQCRIPF